MSIVDGVGDFRWIYSARTPILSVIAGIVHAAGLVAYIMLARAQSRQAKQEGHRALSARFAGQRVVLREEIVAQLANLEAAERVRRLEPDEREELNELRELREWSAVHNRQLLDALAAERAAPETEPDPPTST
jgi:hypothetical protein